MTGLNIAAGRMKLNGVNNGIGKPEPLKRVKPFSKMTAFLLRKIYSQFIDCLNERFIFRWNS